MKLLVLAHGYPEFLNGRYQADASLSTLSYSKQFERVAAECHAWANHIWRDALSPLGYEVEVVVVNCMPLQRAWAKEGGIPFCDKGWIEEIAAAQVRKSNPTIILSTTYNVFSEAWIRQIREETSKLKCFATWCGAPYRDTSVFGASDLVLSCIPELVGEFRDAGFRAVHLNHAFYPAVLDAVATISDPDIDLSFIGQIIISKKFHAERAVLLERLADALPLRIYSPSGAVSMMGPVKQRIREFIRIVAQGVRRSGVPAELTSKIPVLRDAAFWEQARRPLSPKLRAITSEGVFGLEMYRVLARSKVTFNNHIDVSPKSASNMRLFEATGVGTCLLTDWKSNIGELFEPGKEILTYRDEDECVEKAQWLLEHPIERQAIAKAGQERTLRDHTFQARAPELDAAFRDCL